MRFLLAHRRKGEPPPRALSKAAQPSGATQIPPFLTRLDVQQQLPPMKRVANAKHVCELGVAELQQHAAVHRVRLERAGELTKPQCCTQTRPRTQMHA
jgi:hypothetical protein